MIISRAIRSLLVILLFACAPAAAQETVQNLGIGGGAAVSATAVSPHNPGLVIAATTRGTVFISRDAGVSWSLIDCGALSNSQDCQPLFDPHDRNIIYAASGPDLKISRDQGRTWKPLPEDPPPWKSEPLVRLALETAGRKAMYAATRTALYRSEDKGLRWRQVINPSGACVGIATLATHTYAAFGNSIHETLDGGSTWTQKRIVASDRRITGLTGGYSRGGRMVLYAAVPGVGVMGSESMGRSWSLVLAQPAVEDVAMPANQDQVAFAVSRDTVWQTQNGGALWVKCFTVSPDAALPSLARSWLTSSLGRTCRIFPGSLSAAGGPNATVAFGTEGEVFLSRDSGDSWVPAINVSAGSEPPIPGQPLPSSVSPADAYSSIGFEANAPWEYYVGAHRTQFAMIAYSDTGFARSFDQGNTWISATDGSSVKGTFYNIAFDPFSDTRVYAAVADQPDIPSYSQLDRVTGSGGVMVSDNFARTWRPAGKGLPAKPCTWVTVDPKSIKGAVTLYAAVYGEGVFKSADGGKSWVSKSEGLGRPGNKNAFMVKVHPKTGDVYCCVTGIRKGDEFGAPGGLWRSTDGGDTWQELTEKLTLHWPAGFALDPRNPTVVYLTAGDVPSAPAEGGLYMTTTGGVSWMQVFKASDCADGSIASPLRCWLVCVSPHNNDHVYLSTQGRGLYFSKDSAMNWSPVSWVPCRSVSRVSFHPFDKNTILVSTFGGGVWKGPAIPRKPGQQ